MRKNKISSILLVFGVLTVIGCQSKPKPLLEEKPFGETERTLPSLNTDSPEVLAQKMFEADRNEMSRIGPRVLRDWRSKSSLLILDLTTEEMRKQFGILEESQIWDGKKVFNVSKSTTLVLVSSSEQHDLLESSYRKLQKQGYEKLFILDGGIEAWFKIYGRR